MRETRRKGLQLETLEAKTLLSGSTVRQAEGDGSDRRDFGVPLHRQKGGRRAEMVWALSPFPLPFYAGSKVGSNQRMNRGSFRRARALR